MPVKKASRVFPATILIDNNEGHPYTFENICDSIGSGETKRYIPWEIDKKTCYLNTGDYTIKGLEDMVCIERKSTSDLLSTIVTRRDEFYAELSRMSGIRNSFVVIEDEWSSIKSYLARTASRLSPDSVIGSIMSWQLSFPTINWWMLPGRRSAELMTFRILQKVALHKKR